MVMVSREHELDVLELDATRPQTSLQGIQCLIAAWAGVDDGERISAQEPCVHRADVRKWDRDCLN